MEKHMYTYNYYKYRKLNKDSKIGLYLFEFILLASLIFLVCIFVF